MIHKAQQGLTVNAPVLKKIRQSPYSLGIEPSVAYHQPLRRWYLCEVITGNTAGTDIPTGLALIEGLTVPCRQVNYHTESARGRAEMHTFGFQRLKFGYEFVP